MGMQKPVLREGSHRDAVLGLSWKVTFRNVLASGSADKQIKVWDVATQQCQATLKHHSGKVQAVAWNPAEAPVLLSGGYDRRLCLVGLYRPFCSMQQSWLSILAWMTHAAAMLAYLGRTAKYPG